MTEFCHKSFTKIRITDYKPKVTKISELMEDRKSLKQMLAMCEDAFSCAKYQEQIYEIDEMIASECSEENYLKIMENFGKIGHQQDCMNTTGMWGVLKKVFPKNTQPPIIAKRDFSGQIITNQETLEKLYLETYRVRLRQRPIKAEYLELKKLKESLFNLRLKLAKLTKSEPWSDKQLDNVLKCLKKNKSRDPHGLINDLFKPGTIGSNLKQSLLTLVNEIKERCHIPEFIQWANITSLYKGKGDKMDLNNERGIFIVTVVRSILMRLIYNEKYSVIEGNMSDSNVGARKNKNIRNHIFVINGIIHEALKKNEPIDIQIMDYEK